MIWFKKDPLQIIVFQSYGTNSHLYIRGRALEDESIDLEGKHPIKLLINTFKRFEPDQIKNTSLLLTLSDNTVIETVTDDKGYFLVDEKIENLNSLTNEEGWLHVELSYKNITNERIIRLQNRFIGEMLIPETDSTYGVVSDIDDTILHTGLISTMKWRVLYNTFLKTAKSRVPLEGAAEFYHMLHRGKSGKQSNPIFYVSHSPWNMYRYLEYFLKKNNFPKGPILLRDFSKFLNRNDKFEKPQKQNEIINILKTYTELRLILIGDSGEHDPYIYLEIAELYPNRIIAIYLRSVKHKKKMLRVKGLYEHYKTIPVLLVDSSKQAVEHARKHGFIR